MHGYLHRCAVAESAPTLDSVAPDLRVALELDEDAQNDHDADGYQGHVPAAHIKLSQQAFNSSLKQEMLYLM